MASKSLILTGDDRLTSMLNGLARNVARKLNRQASRKAAKNVLDLAKVLVPRKTGAYARSLTVRAIKKSRKYQGYNVTQRLTYSRTGQRGKRAYYGVMQEIGWKAGGKPRGFHGASDMPLEELIKATKKKMNEKSPKRKGATKVEGKWVLRKAGIIREATVIRIYHEELHKLILAEAK